MRVVSNILPNKTKTVVFISGFKKTLETWNTTDERKIKTINIERSISLTCRLKWKIMIIYKVYQLSLMI
jgi:hypothetical protein